MRPTCERHWRAGLALLVLLWVPRPTAAAAGQAAFNYPGPPREGPPGYFTIAEQGRARCVIVSPADAPEAILHAAQALAEYLGLATGGTFRVVADGVLLPDDMAAIHVGETAAARRAALDLPDVRYGADALPNLNGYLVKTLDPRTLVIRGPTDAATVHGVVGFLKRYVGVRQYWPGEPGGLGEVIPARPTLRVPQVEWRDWPYVYSRSMSLRPFAGKRERVLDFYRRHRTLPCNENYNAWLPPAKFSDAHPEFFSLVNGRRSKPRAPFRAAGWQPCASNPEAARIMAEGVADYFRTNPAAAGVNFAINDGGNDCACAACRALDAPGANYSTLEGLSDRYVRLTHQVCQRVRKEFPGKLIVFLAYAAARRPPAAVGLDPMAAPVLTTPGNAFRAWDEWMRRGPRHMGLYVHHDDLFFVLPKFDLRQSMKRIRYIVASGRARIFYMEMHNHWPFNDLIPYVAAELLWNPRQDAAALLDEYYAKFYGPAGKAMREFHAALEAGYERWLDEEGESSPHGRDVSAIRHARAWAQFRVLTPREASRAAAALARAQEAARGRAKEAERVRVWRLMFGLQQLAVQQYWTAERLRTARIESEAGAQGVVEDAGRIFALSRDAGAYINNVLEAPPANAYGLFRRTARRVALYEQMKAGRPGPELLAAVGAGIDAAEKFLKNHLSSERAAAWWRQARQGEKEPALAAAFEAAEMRARGLAIENLLADPGFEAIGSELAPDEFVLNSDIVLAPKQEHRVGVRQWFPERSPYRVVLTPKAAHSGRYALMLERCHRARLSRFAPAAAGDRFRVSLWFKRNAGAGRYAFAVDARLKAKGYPRLASVPIAHPPGEWRQLTAEVTIPAHARTVFLRLYVNGQCSDARCWVDDLFIGRYPR